MASVFFYGLFMDHTLLTEQGLRPMVVGPAVLPGYRIHIGERATLLRSSGRRALGLVMELSADEARKLYSDPTVSEYVAERVRVELLESGEVIDVDCYNLPPDRVLTGTNQGYATKLAALARVLHFDPGYVEEIAAFGEGTRDDVGNT